MPPFRYMGDPVFVLGCIAYVTNRWLLKPHIQNDFLHSQFNDLWLIPCALPLMLWLHRQFGLRSHDHAPHFAEIFWHLVFWSLLFEWIGPKFVTHTTGDFFDVLAYAFGAILSALWWHRKRLFRVLRHEL